MGVPDFLKFAARTSPTALCRIKKGVTAAPLCFDFVLIDATNVCQTIGLETLAEFLMQPHLKVRRAVVFAMDAQRHRAGTSRSQRTHATVLDADVAVQRLCIALQQHYNKIATADAPQPQILISGRQVAGEADYKILDLQRQLVTQAFAAKVKLPTFCFVSEDSDVLCGVLCGPAPHTVTIATKLHDTMLEMCVLRVAHVLAYIARCVDAFAGGDEGAEVSPQTQQQQQRQLSLERESVKNEGGEEEKIVRRQKQDGPMVATGTCVVLSDSDGDPSDVDEEGPGNCVPSPMPAITAQNAAEAEILQNSCIDMVFLFVVVMGNGSSVPPLVRGATKVDIQSCWKAYCRMKYDTAELGYEKVMGRSLLSLHDVLAHPEKQSNEIAAVAVDCSFLGGILETAHYADAQSRPPVEEEKERALLFLSQAVYTTFRYIIACNLHPGSTVEDTFLDTRSLLEKEFVVPSLAAFLWVLGLTRKRTLYFPLAGLATEAVLLNATKGISAVEEAVAAACSRRKHAGQNVVLEWDVANTLVTCGSAGSRRVRLQSLLPRSKPDAHKGMVVCINECAEGLARNSSDAAGNVVPQRNKAALFSRLLVAWRSTMTSFMPALEVIARKEDFTLLPTNKDSYEGGGVLATQANNVKYSYSFELRRMAPLLTSCEKKHQISTATSAALLRALRVSHDYEKAPSVSGISSEVTEGRDRKRGQFAKSNAPSTQKGSKTEGATEGLINAERREGQSGKYRRPGKKERERAKRARENN
ncbi:hypothetical protein C3747_40g168 [Trypanosoma cruzi]|uniref:Xrn1 N-terminal domain-containing protein n=2 Tax=Trypanosoma cruzi TaxID=5693 RepID=Q4DP65_TRYCC|nr:hypothetical protein, conserved [Trypanosoma cruzi]EAN94317.1 hypothetical protein, conserved [Trypanosoma cruzi]PWV13966.1 hypothetical protein C3747_40g168 [Trypanosoma cruzi]RNC60096.1 hypothetical protein TcCL_ESM02185 [Trypanosoma cruzi]|eukprot:XP_816168.1 hypothetical protein [Trypanosoma cruzi strain CL Brener]